MHFESRLTNGGSPGGGPLPSVPGRADGLPVDQRARGGAVGTSGRAPPMGGEGCVSPGAGEVPRKSSIECAFTYDGWIDRAADDPGREGC
jgi:hypothetical protein